ncbi:MAG: sulfurtransferase TusA family protein [Methanomassiliicoccales archaeon]|nr:sulfurtransferase TusA family protein [Methanomassiliicoccales archaeon]
MEIHKLDTLGLKCPQPILEVAVRAKQLPPGDVIEVISDCESFPRDVKAWCERTGKTLLFVVDEGNQHKAQIQL